MRMLINLVINALAVFLTAQILPGIRVENFMTAIVVALILGLINIFLKPIIVLLTLPINIATLGLFTFVINALIILLVSNLVQGFKVENFLWALVFSLVLSIVNSVLQSLTK